MKVYTAENISINIHIGPSWFMLVGAGLVTGRPKKKKDIVLHLRTFKEHRVLLDVSLNLFVADKRHFYMLFFYAI